MFRRPSTTPITPTPVFRATATFNMMNIVRLLLLTVLSLNTTGCGTFIAHTIARAPNLYPAWLAPHAPVTLAFSPRLLTNFVTHYVDVGPPPAWLCYRIIEPADCRGRDKTGQTI